MVYVLTVAPFALALAVFAANVVRDHWAVKLLAAWLLALFTAEPTAILLLSIAITADFFAGTWASLRRGERFQIKRARATINKTIQYGLFLALLVGISNRYEVVSLLGETGFFFATILEVASVAKHLGEDDSPVKRLWKMLQDRFDVLTSTDGRADRE